MSKTKIKGRPITCKKCKTEFKFKTKKERTNWEENKQECPSCGEWYCNLIETERKLFTYQELYYETKNEKYINEIYECLVKYGGSLAKTLVARSLRGDDHLKYHTHTAATLVIEQFYNHKCKACGGKLYAEKENKICYCDEPEYIDYRIQSSFGSYLVSKLKESLYGKQNLTAGSFKKKNEDESVTVVTPVSIDRPDKLQQDDEETSLQIEQEASEVDLVEEKNHKKELVQGILKIIFEEDPKLTNAEIFHIQFLVLKSLSGKKKDIESAYSALGKLVKFRVDFIMNQIYKYLKYSDYDGK